MASTFAAMLDQINQAGYGYTSEWLRIAIGKDAAYGEPLAQLTLTRGGRQIFQCTARSPEEAARFAIRALRIPLVGQEALPL